MHQNDWLRWCTGNVIMSKEQPKWFQNPWFNNILQFDNVTRWDNRRIITWRRKLEWKPNSKEIMNIWGKCWKAVLQPKMKWYWQFVRGKDCGVELVRFLMVKRQKYCQNRSKSHCFVADFWNLVRLILEWYLTFFYRSVKNNNHFHWSCRCIAFALLLNYSNNSFCFVFPLEHHSISVFIVFSVIFHLKNLNQHTVIHKRPPIELEILVWFDNDLFSLI